MPNLRQRSQRTALRATQEQPNVHTASRIVVQAGLMSWLRNGPDRLSALHLGAESCDQNCANLDGICGWRVRLCGALMRTVSAACLLAKIFILPYTWRFSTGVPEI